jgi:transglutaminase-like putative cysteine protease
MSKHQLYGLLLAILMVIAPHAEHLPFWVSAICVSLLVWRSYLVYSGNPLPSRWLLLTITLATMSAIFIDFHTLLGREVGVTLLMLLATLKAMELKSRRDAMALIYLACFILITSFFYSQSISTGLYMLVTLFATMAAWVHLHTPGINAKPRLKIATVLLLQAIPLTLILFVLFPRIQGPLWGLPQDAFSSSGLDDTMSPGSVGRLALSDAVTFRVTYQGPPPRREQMYWRGPVLWNFDGRTWTAGKTLRGIAPHFTATSQPIDYSVTLEPHNKTWLFTLDVPDKISAPARVTADFQVLSTEPVTARLRYEARSLLQFHANVEESPGQLQRALQLPPTINPQTRQLAASWRAAGLNDAKIVSRALNYFNQQQFHYTLEPPPLGYNSIDDFLFTTRQGFCEHYSSAFVFLMRAAGIPARVVTGYQGGEYNDVGRYYIVRQSDAHAWAEVWLAERGWIRIDPTAAIAPERVEHGLSAALPDNTALPFMARNPPQWLLGLRANWDAASYQWNQWVIGYNSERQFAFLTHLGMESTDWQQITINMMAGLALVIALFAAFMLRHLVKRETDKTQAAWLKLCQKLAKAGLPRKPHEGPNDYAMRIANARPDLAREIKMIAARYLNLRYAGVQDEKSQHEFIRQVSKFRPRQEKSVAML